MRMFLFTLRISLFIRSGAKYPLCIQNIIGLDTDDKSPRDDGKYGNSGLKRSRDWPIPDCPFFQLKISSKHKVKLVSF